jgi:hypothetical protein
VLASNGHLHDVALRTLAAGQRVRPAP